MMQKSCQRPQPPIGSADMLYDADTISKFADCGISILDSPDVIPQALSTLVMMTVQRS